MTWSATRRLKQAAWCAAVASVAAVSALGVSSSAQTAEAAASSSEVAVAAPELAMTREPTPHSDHFPNVVLKTHEGRNVRFYDDLLKGKIVLINFMYATCTER